jgi:hypothetical protein
MKQVEDVEAIRFVRKLRGGSQPVLIEASDGLLYVVKFSNNLQGPNLLFNEAIGTELFRAAGLPVPAWRPIMISESFLEAYPDCWLETAFDRCKPAAGLGFGSRYLDRGESRIFEILAGGYFSRVRERKNFWTAWVLDVLSEHTDNRQALFLESASRWLDAYFIDHGHLLGGAWGTKTPVFKASRYLDARIYAEVSEEVGAAVMQAILGIDVEVLAAAGERVPAEWRTPSAWARFSELLERISNRSQMESTTNFVLGLTGKESANKDHERRLAHCGIGTEATHLCAPIQRPIYASSSFARSGSSLGDPGRLGPQAVLTPWLKAASF